MVEYGAFSHKIDYVSSKSQRACKLLHWVKSYCNFGEQGGFYQVVELHRKDSAPAACTVGLFFICHVTHNTQGVVNIV